MTKPSPFISDPSFPFPIPEGLQYPGFLPAKDPDFLGTPVFLKEGANGDEIGEIWIDMQRWFPKGQPFAVVDEKTLNVERPEYLRLKPDSPDGWKRFTIVGREQSKQPAK